MSSIFTPPVALQDLLGTKAGGRNPDELTRIVQPTLEQIKFLAAGRGLQFTQATVTPTAQGYWPAATLTVPQGYAWLLAGLTGVGVATGAGDTFTFAVAASGDGTYPWACGQVGNVVQATNVRGISSIIVGENFMLLPPGHSLGAYLTVAGAVTNVRVDLAATYVPLAV